MVRGLFRGVFRGVASVRDVGYNAGVGLSW